MKLFRSYMADLVRDGGGDFPRAAILVALGALLEGIGIVAIVPLVSVATGNTDTELARAAIERMGALGVSNDLARATVLSGGFLALLALRGWVVWKRDVLLFEMGVGYVDRLRSRLFLAIGQARWSYVSGLYRADIEHALISDLGRLSLGTDRVLRAAASLVTVAVLLVLVVALAPMLLLLIAVLLALVGLATGPLIRRAGDRGRALTREGKGIHRILGNFLAGQKIARLHNEEAAFACRFDQSVRSVRQVQTAFNRSQVLARTWLQLAAGVVVVATLLLGLFVVRTPLSLLVLSVLVLARLVGPTLALSQAGQSIANALPAYAALHAMLANLDANSRQPPAPCEGAIGTSAARLSLEGVSFRHTGAQEPVLDALDLVVEPGAIVALTGPSGIGKTTLLDVIAGLQEPDSGSVVVDGTPLSSEGQRREWRSQIAILPQDPFLFDASLRENLVWGAREADDAAIWAALAEAAIDERVRQMPKGLDSRAGERGQNLSGGERQRLCLARALLRQPRLLILDEATNALDARLEQQIFANLSRRRGAMSLLVVTHRTSALGHADRVVVFSEGRLEEADVPTR